MRDPDMERRLLNWAKWRWLTKGGGGENFARCDMAEERVDGGGGYDAPITVSVIDEEAWQMDAAVATLESALRRTVEVVYLEGGNVQRKAAKLCVSERTVHTRIDQAHRKLAAWFTDRQQQQREKRARTEALQRSVRAARGF